VARAQKPGPLQLNVSVPGAADLGDEQKKILQDRIESFAAEMFTVAETFERRSRGSTSKTPQFTTAHLADAYIEARRSVKTPLRALVLAFALRILLYLAAAGIGVGGNNLTQNWGIALFWASLSAGLIMVAILEVRGWKGE